MGARFLAAGLFTEAGFLPDVPRDACVDAVEVFADM